jgi:hypothetical protein
MTGEAMVNSIRRHVAVLRDDPVFSNYIVNLALYLVELHRGDLPADRLQEPRPREAAKTTPSVISQLETTGDVDKRPDSCPLCGSPTQNKRVCPHCGHMVG